MVHPPYFLCRWMGWRLLFCQHVTRTGRERPAQRVAIAVQAIAQTSADRVNIGRPENQTCPLISVPSRVDVPRIRFVDAGV